MVSTLNAAVRGAKKKDTANKFLRSYYTCTRHQVIPIVCVCRVPGYTVYAITAVGLLWLPRPCPLPCPGRDSVYLAKARARAFLQLTFWLPTKLSTVTEMALSMSCVEQYSDSRMRQKASLRRMMASRWRTCHSFISTMHNLGLPGEIGSIRTVMG